MRTFLVAIALMACTIVAVSYLRGDTSENPHAIVAGDSALDPTQGPPSRVFAVGPPPWRRAVDSDLQGACPGGYTPLPRTASSGDVTCVLPPAVRMAREAGVVFVTRIEAASPDWPTLPGFLRRACRDRTEDVHADPSPRTWRDAVICRSAAQPAR